MTPCPFWLMMVSTASAVLPVPRSPMISSRWPRPIGIIESIALIPVCIGSRPPLPGGVAGGLPPLFCACGRAVRALAVDRHAQRVDHAADQRVAHRHLRDLARALDLVAFLDLLEVAEERDAD